eukprot:PITA_00774
MTSMDDKNKHHYSLSNACEHDDAAETTRTGTLWTAVAYIITSVIGAGVLSLSWAVAQLGWIAGPVVMIIFALITLYSTFLLVDCYRFPDPVSGPHRNTSYRRAVRVNLGERKAWLCALVQYLLLYGICVAYTITTSVSVRAISRSNCYHKNGHDSPCHFPDLTSMVIYGVMQVILCQIPNFHKLWGLSIVAAIMSFTYATLGIGLGLAKVIENGKIQGTLGGISTTISLTRAQKVWKILPALGDIAFAFPFSPLVLEIQDTLKSPPAENRTMKKATMISIVITASFYMLCGLLGYAAFGENAPGNLLTGFGFYEPYWLIDFANACIVVHLVGAYQVTSQPIFNFIEGWISQKWADSVLISKTIGIRVPFLGFYHVNILRLVWRTAFVVSTTGIAILFPLFNDVVGILGALNFWPLVVYFPVEMYIVQKKVQRWTLSWNLLQTLSFVALLVTLVTAVGSIESLVKDKET